MHYALSLAERRGLGPFVPFRRKCGGCAELDEMSAEDAARPVPPEKQLYR